MLVLLKEEPMHGYQIIQQLGERSGGVWRPSAGSVYPTLQQLEDEGLVKGEDRDGRNVFSLTDEGLKAAEEAAKNRAPCEMTGSTDAVRLFDLFMPLGEAVKQVSAVGSPETVAKARTILIDARKSLYRLLAEDEDAESTPTDK
jgi:DNA-binding PadR family transcriptional regulator